MASAPSAGAFFERLANYENTPPLFYALLAPLPLDSELWLRVPSLIAGTLWIPVVFAIASTLGDRRCALFAALAVAVAPYAVSFSDYSRGFTLAGLAELLALLAGVKLLAGAARPGRWAVMFVVAGTCALYAEYASLAFLVVLVVALVALDRARWRTWVVLGGLPLVLFAPWLGQWQRSLDQLGVTKLDSAAAAPSPAGARDAVAALVFGEHGAAGSGLLRGAQALAVLAVVAWALTRLSRTAAWTLGAALLGVPLIHAVVSAVGADVFRQRYLTVLIAIGAIAVALAASRSRWARALPAAAAVLVVLGCGLLGHRAGREYEADVPAAVRLARASGAEVIFTNSAVVAFYGRDGRVVLDRPLGLPAAGAPACPAACAVIDDERIGGVRPGTGPQTSVGPFVVRGVTASGR